MSKKKKKKNKLGEFHYHEALDRCYILCGQVDEHLAEHPVVKKHKKIKKNVKKAVTLLAESYQLIGGLGYVLFDEKQQKTK